MTGTPGYRDYGEGRPSSIGKSGYSWIATTNDIGGMYLDFGTQHLNPNGTPPRSYGHQLRCLSE